MLLLSAGRAGNEEGKVGRKEDTEDAGRGEESTGEGIRHCFL